MYVYIAANIRKTSRETTSVHGGLSRVPRKPAHTETITGIAIYVLQICSCGYDKCYRYDLIINCFAKTFPRIAARLEEYLTVINESFLINPSSFLPSQNIETPIDNRSRISLTFLCFLVLSHTLPFSLFPSRPTKFHFLSQSPYHSAPVQL